MSIENKNNRLVSFAQSIQTSCQQYFSYKDKSKGEVAWRVLSCFLVVPPLLAALGWGISSGYLYGRVSKGLNNEASIKTQKAAQLVLNPFQNQAEELADRLEAFIKKTPSEELGFTLAHEIMLVDMHCALRMYAQSPNLLRKLPPRDAADVNPIIRAMPTTVGGVFQYALERYHELIGQLKRSDIESDIELRGICEDVLIFCGDIIHTDLPEKPFDDAHL